MKVCIDCFGDRYIRNHIENQGEPGFCDICKKDSTVLSLDKIADFFIEFFDSFSISDKGHLIENEIHRIDSFFTSNLHINTIVDELYQNFGLEFMHSTNVLLKDEVIEREKYWEDLKYDVKKWRRFLTDIETLKVNINWVVPQIIKKDSILYRARILENENNIYGLDEMGPPPPDKASAGRANPIGIPYLYLCETEVTTFYEIRSNYLDKVCVAEFQALEDLKVIDLTQSISPLFLFSISDDDLQYHLSQKLLLEAIGKEMSKPIRRYDSLLDYIPTQLFCELCREMKMDGIIYSSSLHRGGKNIVIFYPEKMKCLSVRLLEVKEIEITSRVIE